MAAKIDKAFLTEGDDLASIATSVEVYDSGLGDRRTLGIEASFSLSDGADAIMLDLTEFLVLGQDPAEFSTAVANHLRTLDAIAESAIRLRDGMVAALTDVLGVVEDEKEKW